MDGPDRDWGQLNCGCHPNCGIGTVLFVNKRTKQMVPLLDFLDMDGLLADLREIFDTGRGGNWARAQLVASLLRNYRPEKAPRGFNIQTLIKQFLSQTGAAHSGEGDANEYEWRVLFVAGMWFQDLFNYDFRRTEMCIIPYGTQMGEISFCAYNTGSRLAPGPREDQGQRHRRRVVQEVRKTPCIRQEPGHLPPRRRRDGQGAPPRPRGAQVRQAPRPEAPPHRRLISRTPCSRAPHLR